MVPLLPAVTRRLVRWAPGNPDFPLVSHANGRLLASGHEIWDEAIASVGLPVCWPVVVDALRRLGSSLYECGHGGQLANLTRWADRQLQVISLQDPGRLTHWRARSDCL
jgi:malonyl CoA-acyl carrier protein transacylase